MRRSLELFLLLVAFALGAICAPVASTPALPAAQADGGASGVVSMRDVPFPSGFEPYGGVEPSVYFTRDGAHVIGVQGTYNGRKDLFGWYVFKWYPGRAGTAFQLGDGMLTTGRGILQIADHRLWAWGFEGNRLRTFQILDWVSPDDAQNAYVP